MKGLKKSELKVGEMYRCRLSGLKHLITDVETKRLKRLPYQRFGDAVDIEVESSYFNPVNGEYYFEYPDDYQLEKLEE